MYRHPHHRDDVRERDENQFCIERERESNNRWDISIQPSKFCAFVYLFMCVLVQDIYIIHIYVYVCVYMMLLNSFSLLSLRLFALYIVVVVDVCVCVCAQREREREDYRSKRNKLISIMINMYAHIYILRLFR